MSKKFYFDFYKISTFTEITVKGAIGEDGSGGHCQRRGKDIELNTRNRIVGGFRISRIHAGDQLIHHVNSQAGDTERVFMIVPGKEAADTVRQIWKDIENDYKKASLLTIKYHEVILVAKLEFKVQGDGKMDTQLTGLGGAFCLLCYATEEDANDPVKIEQGFPIERTLEEIWEIWNMLTNDGTQEIKKQTKDYAIRGGATQMPMLTVECKLDPTKNIPEMHFILHLFDYSRNTYITMKARQILGRLPERGSKGRGNKISEEDEEALAEALRYFTLKLREPPLNLMTNAPDPHGHGGSVENGNTCRTFFDPKNREAVIRIYEEVATTMEVEHLRMFFLEGYAIYHIMNSTGKIDVEAFSELVHESYMHWKEAFPYQKIFNSIHWTLGHIGELTELNDGYATGEISEGALEVVHKNYRRISEHLARNTSFADNCKDSMRRLWIGSDPVTRLNKPTIKKRKNKLASEDAKFVAAFFI